MADDEAVKAACRLPRQSKQAILSCYRKAKAKGVLRPYVTVAVECGVPLDVVASCVGQFLRDDDARSVISLATAADSVIDTSTLPTTLLPSWKRQWEEQEDEREEERTKGSASSRRIAGPSEPPRAAPLPLAIRPIFLT